MSRLAVGAAMASLLWLAGCGGAPEREQEATGPSAGDAYQASRYSRDRDGVPIRPIRPEDVADAVPQAEPILAAGNYSPYTVNGVSYRVLEDFRSYREQGIASWYGIKFHGHETSNGEVFDAYAASAAHKTLPIPCFARVTNLDNGRSVVVRVNDRGPFHSDRLIDLSYGAAVRLGYMEQGTARVEVAVIDVAGIDDRRNSPQGQYRYLQVGAFSQPESAHLLQTRLQGFVAGKVSVSEVEAGGRTLYRVRVGPLADAGELALVQQQLRQRGFNEGQPLP